ncbi:hypothetical protein HNP46_000283 [Pseudomonas nitritireducens]|uniref:Uncharacterized protein n=2 Tax=Pseudomonas nitroreducens TaxID=46680 RepID=A0A7W7NZQ8_PSENT|nr:hypothetical protein [Pseudomonas nitritireducens]
MSRHEAIVHRFSPADIRQAFPVTDGVRQRFKHIENDQVFAETYKGKLPAPIRYAGDDEVVWIGCHKTGMHTDPEWKDKYFLSLVIEANHTLYATTSARTVRKIHLTGGELFVLDPMRIHWLERPWSSKDVYLSIQWVVPAEEMPAFLRTLRKELGKLADSNGHEHYPSVCSSEIY